MGSNTSSRINGSAESKIWVGGEKPKNQMMLASSTDFQSYRYSKSILHLSPMLIESCPLILNDNIESGALCSQILAADVA